MRVHSQEILILPSWSWSSPKLSLNERVNTLEESMIVNCKSQSSRFLLSLSLRLQTLCSLLNKVNRLASLLNLFLLELLASLLSVLAFQTLFSSLPPSVFFHCKRSILFILLHLSNYQSVWFFSFSFTFFLSVGLFSLLLLFLFFFFLSPISHLLVFDVKLIQTLYFI